MQLIPRVMALHGSRIKCGLGNTVAISQARSFGRQRMGGSFGITSNFHGTCFSMALGVWISISESGGQPDSDPLGGL